MFFARSASFFAMSMSFSASTVIEVSGTAETRYSDSVPSSSGLPRVADALARTKGELVGVRDDVGAKRKVGDVGLQRRRVHRDQHVRRIARRHDVVIGELQLERRNAGQRAGRCADFGREVRQRRQVVAERGRLGGEAVAGQLHAVAGVAGEPDDHPVELLNLLAGNRTRRRREVDADGAGDTGCRTSLGGVGSRGNGSTRLLWYVVGALLRGLGRRGARDAGSRDPCGRRSYSTRSLRASSSAQASVITKPTAAGTTKPGLVVSPKRQQPDGRSGERLDAEQRGGRDGHGGALQRRGEERHAGDAERHQRVRRRRGEHAPHRVGIRKHPRRDPGTGKRQTRDRGEHAAGPRRRPSATRLPRPRLPVRRR